MKRIKLLLLAVVLVGSFSMQAQLNLLSGLKGGTYEALSIDIQKASSQEVVVLNSEGSVDNFNQLVNMDNNIYVTFMQYDVLLHNEKTNSKLKKELRVLLPLFLDEEVHIITKKGSGIKNLKDLKGKKVAVGEKNQGAFITASTIKKATKTEWIDVEMNAVDAQKALDAGSIDAYFYVGGAPVKSLVDLGKKANLQLVNIKSKGLEEVYSQKEIAKGTYPWQKSAVTTFAVPTLLVCNVKDMTLETRRKLNTLLTDTKKAMPTFLKTGHKKWKDVYIKSHAISWPYYYLKPIVE